MSLFYRCLKHNIFKTTTELHENTIMTNENVKKIDFEKIISILAQRLLTRFI